MIKARLRADIVQIPRADSPKGYFTRGAVYAPGTYAFRYVGGCWAFGLDAGQPDYTVYHDATGVGAFLVSDVARVTQEQAPAGVDFNSTDPSAVYAANRAGQDVVFATAANRQFGMYIYDDFIGDNSPGPLPTTVQLVKAVRSA